VTEAGPETPDAELTLAAVAETLAAPAGSAATLTDTDKLAAVPTSAPDVGRMLDLDAIEQRHERKLRKWSQGDLVPGLTLFWAGVDGVDPLTGMTHEAATVGGWAAVEYDDSEDEPATDRSGWRLGVITSQSCDIEMAGVGRQHPFVQVSAVIRAEDHFPGRIPAILKREIGYLYRVDNVPASLDGRYDAINGEIADGTWVADLRISLPLSKAALLNAHPRSAFRDPNLAVKFGEYVAAKIRRPSWHDDIAERFRDALGTAITAARKTGAVAWLAPVEQVRLELIEGTRIDPVRVVPWVLFNSDFPSSDRQPWYRAVSDAAKVTAKAIHVLDPQFGDLTTMTAVQYREMDPLPLPLGRPAYRKQATKDLYATMVRVHLKPAPGHVELGKLKASDVEALIVRKRSEGLSASTIRTMYTVLRGALEVAVRDGLVRRNVAATVRRPATERTEAVYLTTGQAQQLLTVLAGDRLEALYRLMLATGLRRGEALALHWDDVDLDENVLRVRRTLSRTSKGLQITEPKTERSRRTVPLPRAAVEALKAHRKRQAADQLAAGPAWQPCGLVFATEVGTALEPRNVLRRFDALAVKAGLVGVHLHTLRHSAASFLLTRGVASDATAEGIRRIA
jgi:integrase